MTALNNAKDSKKQFERELKEATEQEEAATVEFLNRLLNIVNEEIQSYSTKQQQKETLWTL